MPTATLEPRHWVYLDDERSHEVHAEVEAKPEGTLLVTTEFPAGSREPKEMLQAARRVAAEAELQAAVADLEDRLRLSGTYFRADVRDMRWVPLGPPRSRVDLRGFDFPMPGAPTPEARMSFHHFHEAGGSDRLLISMPRLDVDLTRHVLAELSFRFPQVESGDLRVLHPRLTQATLRASLVQQHLDLPRRGFAKLLEPGDYLRAFGEGWADTTRRVFQGAARRLSGLRETDEILRVRKGDAPDELPDLMAALAAPKLAALKRRYLRNGDADECVAGGEHVIRRLVASKRRDFPHTAAYELSVLEAALLLEYAAQHEVWSLVHEEGAKVLRYVHGYG